MGKPLDTYLETRVLNAGPLELLDLLYGAAIGAVRNARGALERGDIEARSREISKAQAILLELAATLDHEKAPEIAGRLAELYDYAARRLAEGNLHQQDGPLADAAGVLTTLHEAWKAAVKVAA